MNSKLQTAKAQKFISENLNKELDKVILKGSPFEDISIQELAQQIAGKKTAKKKIAALGRK